MEYKLKKVYDKNVNYLRQPTLHCTNIDCDIVVLFSCYGVGFTEKEIYKMTIAQWTGKKEK